ncbi:hypothetical protein [Marinivivus vitaminiproducens]|uniref:hypothetical protein n=1 Tax=Marinivivus vitaminiproducens TaxID=3035935 RepID=UPI00279AB46A|nr:hypothetical protein P4R82_02565 [Geminicoccaceae bacterium SCSIO 64248]
MPLLTTTLGGYPRPASLDQALLDRYDEAGRETVLDTARQVVVREQTELGIDIPTDGCLWLGDPVIEHLARLSGLAWLDPDDEHADEAQSLVIVGPIRPAAESFLARRWRLAQAATTRPVKVVLPGPMTLAAAVEDRHYQGDARARGADLADALNRELRTLAAAGCRHIQIDEPVAMEESAEASAYGIEHVLRAFHRLSGAPGRVFGFGRPLPPPVLPGDDGERPADPAAMILSVIEDAAFDAIAFETVESQEALARLEEMPRARVQLGLLALSDEYVEEADEVEARIRASLRHIDRDRLSVAGGNGLGALPPAMVQGKLRALALAAHRL